MFTGIVEKMGTVRSLQQDLSNIHFTIESSISDELHVDQSVSHNGVCLTVVATGNGTHTVTAVQETLVKTSLGTLIPGSLVNLERCMSANGRFDGHVVQGHVDGLGTVKAIHNRAGSWQIDFEYGADLKEITVEKGSICINGVSLTCFNCSGRAFSVAIIPYTWEHTTMGQLKPGDRVNLEFDVIGKYVRRLLENSGQLPS